MSAWNLACWLRDQGHEVGVLTAAPTDGDVAQGEMVDGLRIWRLKTPHIYPMKAFGNASGWQKPIWHLQDHFDPRNVALVNRVLDEFQPEHVNIHIAQGLGHNILSCFKQRQTSVVMFMHDLTLACIKTGMFKDGHNCKTQCITCAASSKVKFQNMKGIKKLGFCSPSRANLETAARFFPLKQYKHASIMNANKYPPATEERVPSQRLRFLYAGRIHNSKGTDLLLKVLSELSASHDFTLTIAGHGPDEARLRAEYGGEPWCDFKGFVPQTTLSNLMINSDLLCIPSSWAENSPGVVIHGLGLGLPVLGSDIGGIPELVEDGKNGALLPADDYSAWKNELTQLLTDSSSIDQWRAYAEANKARFDRDEIGRSIFQFIKDVRME